MFNRNLNDDEKLQQRANLLFNKTQEKYPKIGIVKTDYSLGAGMDERDDEEENLNEDLNKEQKVEDTSFEPEQNLPEQEKDYNEIADLFYPSMKEKEEPQQEKPTETEDINTENPQDGVFTGAAAPVEQDYSYDKAVLDDKLIDEIINNPNLKYENLETLLPYISGEKATLKHIGNPPYKKEEIFNADWGKYNSTMSDETKEKLKNYLRDNEIFKPVAYRPTPKDRWTIGYGHTLGVKEGDKITKEQAEKYLEQDVIEHLKPLKHVNAPLTENQKIALASLIFNMGGTRFRNTKLFKNLNNKNYKQAAEEFKDINKSADGKQGGLTTRRLNENEIFLKDIQ